MRINAQQSGNWSDPNTWGGIIPPQNSEIYCNGYDIFVDTDIEALLITNSQTYQDRDMGGCLTITKENCIINSNLLVHKYPLIVFTGNKLTIKGEVRGSLIIGEVPCVINQGFGTIDVEGAIRGGDSGYSPGIINQNTGTINVTGSVCNGKGGWSYGIYNESNGKVFINNNETTERYIGDFCPQQTPIFI